MFLSRSSIINDAHALSQRAEVAEFKVKEATLERQKDKSPAPSVDEDEAYEKRLRAQEFKGLTKKENSDSDKDDAADERYEEALKANPPQALAQGEEQANDSLPPQKLPDKPDKKEDHDFPQVHQHDDNAKEKKSSPKTPASVVSSGSSGNVSFPSFAHGDIRFSEIAWMGTTSSADEEWIELYNASAQEISLQNWSIQKGDGTLLVGERGDELKSIHKIPAGGYFLLERNEAATSVASDKLYDGSLNNAGETLILKDANGNEIDRIDMQRAWQAGSNEVATQGYKPTMSLIGSAWKDGAPTPKAANIESLKVKEFKGLRSFSPLSVVINEIAWMGTSQNSANEWIELFTNATSTIDLSGWTLKSLNGSPAIALAGSVGLGGYVLLERTDDNSVPEISADIIYTGALEDAGNVLILRDPVGNEIDRVDAWYAGDKISKKTMQRENPRAPGNQSANWFSASGTPRAINKKETPLAPSPLAPPNLSLNNYQITSLSFTLVWGLITSTTQFSSFEVQTHDAVETSWQPFYSGTNTQAPFEATRETIYAFRARIHTADGRTSDWREIAAEINQRPLVINEIMYNPFPGSDDFYEYVELFNQSKSFLDLSTWSLVIDGRAHALRNVLGTSLVLDPGGFALIGDKPSHTQDPNIYDGYYTIPSNSSSTLALTIDSSALSLRNSSSRLTLQGPDGRIVDDVSYSSSWGAHGNGRSLERVNPIQGGGAQANWKESALKGTPNRKNLAYDTSARPGTLIPDWTSIDSDTLWTKAQSPYFVQSSGGGPYPTVSAHATLFIEPGVIIKPLSCCYTALKVLGSVNAKGTPADPIIITSSRITPGAGDWGNILFENTARDSILSYVTIENGGYKFIGSGYDSAMVVLRNARVTFDHTTIHASQFNGMSIDGGNVNVQFSTVKENPYAGMYIISGSPSIRDSFINHNRFGIYIVRGAPIIESNTINDNTQFPIEFPASSKPTLRGNLATGNGWNNDSFVASANISEDTTWTKDLPYILESDPMRINASTTLTLEPGVIIKPYQKFLDTNLAVFGTLRAQGSATDPIIITSIHDDTAGGDTDSNGALILPDAGDWRRIVFKSGSSAILSNVSIRYGGYGNVGALSVQSGASVQASSINYQNNIKNSEGI